MKKQVKLTESELYDVIRESVKSLVTELGNRNPEIRTAMAKVAKRAVNNGDDSKYHDAVKSIAKSGGSKEAMKDFSKKFEEEGTNIEEYTDFDKIKMYGPDYDEDFDNDFNMQPANNLAANEGRMAFKVNETQLKAIIIEATSRILKEVGETEDGQKKLGGLAARYSFNGNYDKYSEVDDYAKGKRNKNLKMQDRYAKGFHAEKDRLKDLKKNNK